jgi:hypothetical protein
MQLTKGQFEECDRIFKAIGEEALYLSHYQLAQETNILDPQIWKSYLMDPRTVDYINSEMSIIRTAAINDMVHKAPDSNSVGQSQLINALQKLDEKGARKDGPAFIYCYVPLNDEQKEAPNVRRIHTDYVSQNDDGSWNLQI